MFEDIVTLLIVTLKIIADASFTDWVCSQLIKKGPKNIFGSLFCKFCCAGEVKLNFSEEKTGIEIEIFIEN